MDNDILNNTYYNIDNKNYDKKKIYNRISNISLGKQMYIYKNIFETLNIREVARKLNISFATVSNTLKKIENSIGKTLFIRCGRNGLKAQGEAKKLYYFANQIDYKILEISDYFSTKVNKKNIRICAHILAYKAYIFPFLKKIKNKNFHFIVSSKRRNEAINDLSSDKYDILLYPLDIISIQELSLQFNIKQVKEYNVCLYVNKKSKDLQIIKNKINNEISMDLLGKINISGQDKNTRFNEYKFLINSSNYRYIENFQSNILLSYIGLEQNVWEIAVGEEIEDIFNLTSFKKIQLFNNVKTNVRAMWCLIYKNKDNKNINYVLQHFITFFQSKK